MIVAGMASFHARLDVVPDAVASLVDQVDILYLYLNNVNTVPDFAKHPKIKVFLSKDHLGDLTDNGKFFMLGELNDAYYFSCDDDMIYPPDYVSNTLKYLKELNNKGIVGYHGHIWTNIPMIHYYVGKNGEQPTEKICYRYWNKLAKTIKVDVHSTGHMAFHTSYFKFKITDLPYKKMTDILIAKMAKDNGLDMFTIPRPDNWISYNTKMSNVGRYTICGDFDWTDDSVQCALINSSWKTPRRYGKDYGDYTLPVGRLNENSVVYSFGLGEDSRFDEEIINEFGCVVHIFDPTPRSITFYKNFLSDNKNIRFHDYGLWKEDTTVKFYGPRNHDHISASIDNLQHTTDYFTAQVKRLETIMKELGHEKIDVLKMDIEGAEYDVFYDMINSRVRPGVLVFELHHPRTMNVGAVLDAYGYDLMKTYGCCLTYEER